MRFRPAGGLDLATGALLLGGAWLLAVSIVAAVVLLAPAAPPVTTSATELASASAPTIRPSAALPADRVAAVLSVDIGSGAGGAARTGDHVDVLGYFSHQVSGAQAVTRVLVTDVPVLTVDRSGASVALMLAVPQEAALLLQEAEAQALGARPFVTLRGVEQTAELPSSFSDSDLANRITGAR
jgi:Flp pilus assembly protein CpaB